MSTASYRVAHREEARLRGAAWRHANTEKVRARRAAYRKENLDKERSRFARWYAAHREDVVARATAWNKAHPAAHLRHTASYYATHKTEKAAYRTAYYATHHDEEMACKHRRRARMCGASGDCSAADWKVVTGILGAGCLHPDKAACHGTIHQDHVRPLARGGTNHPTNRQPLCAHHNTAKHTDWVDYRTPRQVKQIMQAFQLHLFEVV